MRLHALLAIAAVASFAPGCRCVDAFRKPKEWTVATTSIDGRTARVLCEVTGFSGYRDITTAGGCTRALRVEVEGAPSYFMSLSEPPAACGEVEKLCAKERGTVAGKQRDEALLIAMKSTSRGAALYIVGSHRPIAWKSDNSEPGAALDAMPSLDEAIDARLGEGAPLAATEEADDGLFTVLVARDARLRRHVTTATAAVARCAVPASVTEKLLGIAEPRALGKAMLDNALVCTGRAAVTQLVSDKKLPHASDVILAALEAHADKTPVLTARIAQLAALYGVREAAPLLEARLPSTESPAQYEPRYPQWLALMEAIVTLDPPRARRLLLAELRRAPVDATEPCVFPHAGGAMQSAPEFYAQKWPGRVGNLLRRVDDDHETHKALLAIARDKSVKLIARQVALALLQLRRAEEADEVNDVKLTECQAKLVAEQRN